MKIIVYFEDIKAQEGEISDALREELEHYYWTLAMEMGEEAHQDFDLAGIAIIAVFEEGDSIHHMPMTGMTAKTITLLESIPEFIDEINLQGEIWYRLILILSADVGRVIYIPKSLVTLELKAWIDRWKEVSNG